jgi:hypothetical protein
MATLPEALHLFEGAELLHRLAGRRIHFAPARGPRMERGIQKNALTNEERFSHRENLLTAQGVINAEEAVRPKALMGYAAGPFGQGPGDEALVPYPRDEYAPDGGSGQENRLTEAGKRGVINAEGAVRPKVVMKYAAADLGRGRLSLSSVISRHQVQRRERDHQSQRLKNCQEPHPLSASGVTDRLFPIRAARYTSTEDTCQEQASLFMPRREAVKYPRAAGVLPFAKEGGSAEPDVSPAGYDSIYHYIERRLSEAIACSAHGA